MGRSDLGRTRRWGDGSSPPAAEEADTEAEAACNLVKSGFFLCEIKAAWCCCFAGDNGISSPFEEHVKIMFLGE